LTCWPPFRLWNRTFFSDCYDRSVWLDDVSYSIPLGVIANYSVPHAVEDTVLTWWFTSIVVHLPANRDVTA
jgi:hypothetical protein